MKSKKEFWPKPCSIAETSGNPRWTIDGHSGTWILSKRKDLTLNIFLAGLINDMYVRREMFPAAVKITGKKREIVVRAEPHKQEFIFLEKQLAIVMDVRPENIDQWKQSLRFYGYTEREHDSKPVFTLMVFYDVETI